MQFPDVLGIKERHQTQERVWRLEEWTRRMPTDFEIDLFPRDRKDAISPPITLSRNPKRRDHIQVADKSVPSNGSSKNTCYQLSWFVDALANRQYSVPPKSLPGEQAKQAPFQKHLAVELAAIDGMAQMINIDPARWIDDKSFSDTEIHTMLKNAGRNYMIDIRSGTFICQIGDSPPLRYPIPPQETRRSDDGDSKIHSDESTLLAIIGSDIYNQLRSLPDTDSQDSVEPLSVSSEATEKIIAMFSGRMVVAAQELNLIDPTKHQILRDRLSAIPDKKIVYTAAGVELQYRVRGLVNRMYLPYLSSQADEKIANSGAFPVDSIKDYFDKDLIPRSLADFAAFCKDLDDPTEIADPIVYLPSSDGALVQFIDLDTSGDPSVVYRKDKQGRLTCSVNNHPVKLGSGDLGQINRAFGEQLMQRYAGSQDPIVTWFNDSKSIRREAFLKYLPGFSRDGIDPFIDIITRREPLTIRFGKRTHVLDAAFTNEGMRLVFNGVEVDPEDQHFIKFLEELIQTENIQPKPHKFQPEPTNENPDKSSYIAYIAELIISSKLIPKADKAISAHAVTNLGSGKLLPVNLQQLRQSLSPRVSEGNLDDLSPEELLARMLA